MAHAHVRAVQAPAPRSMVTPLVLGIGVPTGGLLPVALAMPSTPTLVGSVLHLQVVPLEFGAGGGIVSVTASNR